MFCMAERIHLGFSDGLLNSIRQKIEKADGIDIIVSFLRFSGLVLLLEKLKEASERGAKIKILTSTYLSITEPFALKVLKKELKDSLEIKLYKDGSRSFHPKSYFFLIDGKWDMIIGSSNISESAMRDGVEWNYELKEKEDKKEIQFFHDEFCRLFNEAAIALTDEILYSYASTWKKPKLKEVHQTGIIKANEVQLEALYALEETRKEGADKALIQAATGIGKTYLAAFDSINFKRILFIAHRNEILMQAEKTFRKVRKNCNTGFFTANKKDTKEDIIFASVLTLANRDNLSLFHPSSFDYIIIDEFHHAAALSYKTVLSYFKPKFLLGLTATAERMDGQSIYRLCDYNVPYKISLADAINRDILVPFHYYGIFDDTVNYNEIECKNGRYKISDLTKNLSIRKRAELIFKNYNKYTSSKTLAFTTSREHAIFMASYFSEKGITSASVISGSSNSKFALDRELALNKLEKGEVKVIFTVDIFNEGIDIPDVDLVMFLRPTESPVIFLQQLGRGLRKAKGKEYLNVLDFIGNYNNAFLIPSLLSNNVEKEDVSALDAKSVTDINTLPSGCIVNFDFRLIDLFDFLRRRELTIKEKIINIYENAKEELKRIPSRIELFDALSGDELNLIFSQKKSLNIFRDYISFIEERKDYTGNLCTFERSLINVIENTSMTKSYKIPTLQAFYSTNGLKTHISDKDIINSFKTFYLKGKNYMDMEKDKSTKDFRFWADDKIIRLAKSNPIHYLAKTHPNIFYIDKKGNLSFSKNLFPYLKNEELIYHFLDAIELRKSEYYFKKFDSEIERTNRLFSSTLNFTS